MREGRGRLSADLSEASQLISTWSREGFLAVFYKLEEIKEGVVSCSV